MFTVASVPADADLTFKPQMKEKHWESDSQMLAWSFEVGLFVGGQCMVPFASDNLGPLSRRFVEHLEEAKSPNPRKLQSAVQVSTLTYNSCASGFDWRFETPRDHPLISGRLQTCLGES